MNRPDVDADDAREADDAPLPDLLLFGLAGAATRDPTLAIVRGVAHELHLLGELFEGPIGTTLAGMSRRLRVALQLADRPVIIATTAPPARRRRRGRARE